MTIIIETPAPPTRERLVLVPPGAVREPLPGEYRKPGCFVVGTGEGRDATAADLERAGWVPLAAFVGPLDLLSPPTLAGALEAIAHLRADLRDAVKERDELRHHYDAAGPEHNLLALLDSYESDADTARAQASAAYAMVVAAIGSVGAETIEAAVARLVADRGALLTRAEKAERALRCQCSEPGDSPCRVHDEERADAAERRAEKAEATLAMHGRPTYVEAVERAEKAERERDEALLRAHTGVVHYEILRQSGEEAARQRDEARAEVARLTALDRATDDELVDLYRKIYETHGGGTISVSHDDCRRAGLLAVAARVRQERCLVAQAVAMRAGVTISRTSERVPGTTGMWDVYVTRRPDVPGEHYAYGVPAADVPATLARLLGEVSRG